MFLDCKVVLVYKQDDVSGVYEFQENRSCFDHNHCLDYKGLSKKDKSTVLEYMEKTEFKDHSKVKDITNKSEAFIQGKNSDLKIKIPRNQSAYLLKKTKEKIWGPSSRDAQTLMELANQLELSFTDCLIKIQTSENQLRNFIFCSSNMKKLYTKFNDIILIDSTYRTNRYNLPLFVIAAIDENSKTFVVSFGIVSSEEAVNVEWMLKELFTFLEVPPTIICTDSCPTLKKVINNILPNSEHLLCAWHVSQNIKKHLIGLSIISSSFVN